MKNETKILRKLEDFEKNLDQLNGDWFLTMATLYIVCFILTSWIGWLIVSGLMSVLYLIYVLICSSRRRRRNNDR